MYMHLNGSKAAAPCYTQLNIEPVYAHVHCEGDAIQLHVHVLTCTY